MIKLVELIEQERDKWNVKGMIIPPQVIAIIIEVHGMSRCKERMNKLICSLTD